MFGRNFSQFSMDSTFDNNDASPSVLAPLDDGDGDGSVYSESDMMSPQRHPSDDDSHLAASSVPFEPAPLHPEGMLCTLHADFTCADSPCVCASRRITCLSDQIFGL